MKYKLILKYIDKFSELYLSFKNKQIKIIKKLSDEELNELIIAFKKQALGGESQSCFGFRVDLWDQYAANLEQELYVRNIFKRAKESGIDCYCITCKGKCLGDSHHDIIFPPKTEYEMRIGEMSRVQLIEEILKLNESINKI